MRLHRWISQVQMQFVKILQVEIVHFASWICDFATWRWFRNLEMISQLGDDFVTWFVAWRWFRNLICSCENGIWTCEVAHVRLQVVSQLRNFRKLISQLRNFRSTWCGCLQMAITSSFSLWFAHCLKRWTPDF